MTGYQKAAYLVNTRQAPNFSAAARLLAAARHRKPVTSTQPQAQRLPYKDE